MRRPNTLDADRCSSAVATSSTLPVAAHIHGVATHGITADPNGVFILWWLRSANLEAAVDLSFQKLSFIPCPRLSRSLSRSLFLSNWVELPLVTSDLLVRIGGKMSSVIRHGLDKYGKRQVFQTCCLLGEKGSTVLFITLPPRRYLRCTKSIINWSATEAPDLPKLGGAVDVQSFTPSPCRSRSDGRCERNALLLLLLLLALPASRDARYSANDRSLRLQLRPPVTSMTSHWTR